MAIAAVADALDLAVGSASVLVQAVLDGVPGERRSGEFWAAVWILAGS